MRGNGGVVAYLTTATVTRTAGETAGPALLLVGIAVLASDSAGPYLVAALTGAAALAGPVIGALLDRAERPTRGFAASIIVFAVGLAAIAVLIDTAPLWLLLVVAAIAGLGFPGITGAWTAQLPHLVTGERLHRAYTWDAGTYSLASIIGPPVAAALLTVSGAAPLWLPVVLLVIGLITLRFVRIPAREHSSEHSLASDLRHGIGTILRRAPLRQAVVVTTISFIGQAALFVTAPILTQQLTGSLALTGFVFGAVAVGGVVSVGIMMRFPIRRPDRIVVLGTAANAVCLLIAGFAPNFAVLLIAAFILGLTELPQLSAAFQIRSRESTPRVRAQVFTTASSLRTTAFAIGSALFGAMLGLGVPAVILGGFALYLVSLAWGLLIGPRATRRRRERRATRTLGP